MTQTDRAPFEFLGRWDGQFVATAIHNGHDVRPELATEFVLPEPDRLREEDPHTDRIGALLPARLAAATYAVGTALLLLGEARLLRSGHFLYGLIVAYVVLAFLTQAVLGAILLRAGFLPSWIGWAAIAWNIAWLVILASLTPGNIYYPVLHHVIPLLIGIALLRRG